MADVFNPDKFGGFSQGLALARLIECVYEDVGFEKAIQSLLYMYMPGWERYEHYPKSQVYCSWMWAQRGSELLIVIAGTDAIGHGIFQAQGFGLFLPNIGNDGVNPHYLGTASSILGIVESRVSLPVTKVLISGHSYGGATGLVLATYFQEALPLPNIGVVTFGSPKPGDQAFCDRVNRSSVRRWMNAGDIVPAFPPRASEFDWLATALAPLSILTWDSFRQPRGGYRITMSSATRADSTIGDVKGGFNAVFRADIALAKEKGEANHPIAVYIEHMRSLLVIAKTGTSNEPRRDAPVVTASVPGPKPDLVQLAQLPPEQLAAIIGGVGVYMASFIPPIWKPKVSKLGEIWCVEWHSNIICRCKTHSNAHVVAKRLLHVLRYMQGLVCVDATEFANALQQYFAAAEDAGSGFRPVVTDCSIYVS